MEKKNEVCVPFESAQWWCSTFVAVTAAFKKQNPKTLTADKKLKKKRLREPKKGKGLYREFWGLHHDPREK